MSIAQVAIRLFDFRAISAEWYFEERYIIQGVRDLIQDNLAMEDKVVAIRLLPMIHNGKNKN